MSYFFHQLRVLYYTLKLLCLPKNQLNDKAQKGSSTNMYVVGMERIGLIGIDNQQGGIVNYIIKAPKIIYALKKHFRHKKRIITYLYISKTIRSPIRYIYTSK